MDVLLQTRLQHWRMTGIRIRRREPFNLITTANGGNPTRRRRGAQQKPSHQSVGTNGNYRELLKSCFMGFRRVISFQIGSSSQYYYCSGRCGWTTSGDMESGGEFNKGNWNGHRTWKWIGIHLRCWIMQLVTGLQYHTAIAAEQSRTDWRAADLTSEW